jgi:hypothetical protein
VAPFFVVGRVQQEPNLAYGRHPERNEAQRREVEGSRLHQPFNDHARDTIYLRRIHRPPATATCVPARCALDSRTDMRGRRRVLPFLTLLMLGLLVPFGCASDPPSSPTPRSVQRPTVQATNTLPPSPTATNTSSPTASPLPLPSPTSTARAVTTSAPTLTPTPTRLAPTVTRVPVTPSVTDPPPSPTLTQTATDSPPSPTPTLAPAAQVFVPTPPPGRSFATLDEFWTGSAEWVLEVQDVGLPVGESDTIHRGGGEFWSYLHASHKSAGVVDSCGNPAPFPGCVTLWKSHDGGVTFSLENPVCLFSCASCPCDPTRDHPGQQQYPRVFFDIDRAYIVYEWGASTYLRTSQDGLRWSPEAYVPSTGQWTSEARPCTEAESIGEHPNIYAETEFGDCLVGAPPGIIVEGDLLYVFIGLGRDPGHMGCYVGDKRSGAAGLRRCTSNPFFGAENGYGPLDARGGEANPYFEFRTISSADVVRVGHRYYMTYKGVRGPSDPTVVDDQFALGFARSVGPACHRWPVGEIPGQPGDHGCGQQLGHRPCRPHHRRPGDLPLHRYLPDHPGTVRPRSTVVPSPKELQCSEW